MKLAEIWDRLVCALYPPRCVLCDLVVEYDDLLCPSCAVLPAEPRVIRERGSLCALYAPYTYADGVKEAILRLKHEPEARAVRYFADGMHRALNGRRADLIVPVPASAERLAQRGFNQAELLASALADRMGIPCGKDSLRRSDDTQTQHTLSAALRAENAKRSYAAGPSIGQAANKRVLLIDDVYTTGSTMDACTALLLGAGAAEVCGCAAAYTASAGPGPDRAAPPKCMR